MEGHSFCEHGRAAEQGGRGLTRRSVLLAPISLHHEGGRGMSQAEGPKAGCSPGVFSSSFPSLLSLMLLQHEQGLTHKDGEANPSLLAFSHIMNGYRD